MSESGNQINSPKSSTSNASTSTFKSLKKKIRNKFRISRTDEVKTIAQAVEALKRSDELMAKSSQDPEALKNEFKELKETLESIINQNQVLSEVVKVVDSACPDPINEPEKFTVYFAQKSLSNHSWDSEEFSLKDSKSDEVEYKEEIIIPHSNSSPTVDVENAVVRLQNLRMEEQRAFQAERENYEARLGQITLLQQEIELLRKQNSEHQLQLDFLKSQSSQSSEKESALHLLERQLESTRAEFDSQLLEANSKIENLSSQISQKDSEIGSLLNQLENSNLQIEELNLKNQESIEKDKDNGAKDHEQEIESLNAKLSISENEIQSLKSNLADKTAELQQKISQIDDYQNLVEENSSLKLEIESLTRQISNLEKQPLENAQVENEGQALMPKNDEIVFKYIYLSNLVLKFMQFPDQRPELSHLIWTTLKTEQDYFQNIMKDSK